jgi:flagellar biosynthesis protein FlhB
MMENGRFIPPSDHRLAAAFHEGVFPRSRTLVAGVVCLISAGVAYAMRESIGAGLIALMEGGIAVSVHRNLSATEFLLWACIRTAPLLIVLVFLPFLGALIAALLPIMLFRRRRSRAAVPIPRVRGGGAALTVFRLFGAAVFLVVTVYLVREFGRMPLSSDTGVRELSTLLLKIPAVLGGVLTFVGTAEILLKRAAIFRALHLNRAEARREQRVSEGNRQMAAMARRRARREGSASEHQEETM